ncbi:hypothetical protein C4D60_Mb01t12040 [Musa balbisiana]|uniref:Uncharacterized protein n=1 Tax=Musa balbisiana TaxID=52838 RepID=A0A4V4H7A3_MUSBA|nr:hypothetical protein C4D60_Mb01t12040 [Musa balbisiana]
MVNYLANWVVDTPLPGCIVAFADVYDTESDQHKSYFFTERKPKNNGNSRVDQKVGIGSWTLKKKQELV